MNGFDDKKVSSIKTEEKTLSENNTQNKAPERGLYKNAKIPVKILNIGIVIGIIVLVLVTVFLAIKGSYSVSFEPNGGTAVTEQSLKYGKLIAVPEASQRTGYSFEGWYADKELTNPWHFGKGLVEGNMTLYAKWVPDKINIYLDAKGGSFNDNSDKKALEADFGEGYGNLPTPSKDGFAFLGWHYKNAKIDSESKVDTNAEHTLTAEWKIN